MTGAASLSPADEARLVGLLQGIDSWVHTAVHTGVNSYADTMAQELARLEELYGDITVPTEGARINWSLLTAGWGDITRVFPFSLPWDMVGIIGSLRAERETPHFEVQLPEALYNEKLVIDLADFEGVAAMVRALVLGLWVLGLVLVTQKISTW